MPENITYSNALIIINKLLSEIYKKSPNIDEIVLGLETKPLYTPTELVREINDPNLNSAIKVNKKLEELGLQTSERIDGAPYWFPSKEGMKYAKAYSERHYLNETHEIRELRFAWDETVIPIIIDSLGIPTERSTAQ